MRLFSAVVTLFLIMDPLGNVPLFLSVLKDVAPERRRRVLIREVLFSYLVLLTFLFLGKYLLQLLRLQQETISIAGGIVLFLIALRMIFPPERGLLGEPLEGEPFVVPLAIPLIAGPSTLAALLLLQSSGPNTWAELVLAVTIAWAITALILLSSTYLYRLLKQRGLIAMERLMGMLLVMLAVQMFMDGVSKYPRP
ncbi:MAG TPA: YhgN family NAAT transporter [Pyrinomonadaceae bacterium]|jgi:multiple antibiotic resistance protein|nr:YhgN family NAAT transporter [Pyrinomonadaceae bacterium]